MDVMDVLARIAGALARSSPWSIATALDAIYARRIVRNKKGIAGTVPQEGSGA